MMSPSFTVIRTQHQSVSDLCCAMPIILDISFLKPGTGKIFSFANNLVSAPDHYTIVVP